MLMKIALLITPFIYIFISPRRCHWVKMAICSYIAAKNFNIMQPYNLAVNFCLRQNLANPIIRRIFGSAGCIKKFS